MSDIVVKGDRRWCGEDFRRFPEDLLGDWVISTGKDSDDPFHRTLGPISRRPAEFPSGSRHDLTTTQFELSGSFGTVVRYLTSHYQTALTRHYLTFLCLLLSIRPSPEPSYVYPRLLESGPGHRRVFPKYPGPIVPNKANYTFSLQERGKEQKTFTVRKNLDR